MAVPAEAARVRASRVDFLEARLVAAGTVAVIRDVAMSRFALTYGPGSRRRWFLGE